jgi:putative phosphoesterase
MTFRIGIISDTHGLLRPEAERCLMGVDHIIHAGDIGRPDIVDALRRIAPVTAIRGNVDSGEWARECPDTKLVRLAGKSIYVLHDLKTLQADPGVDVIISGHSHVPKIDTVGGVLYLNPGSAGRRRFKLPITLATLEVTPAGLRPAIHDLEAARLATAAGNSQRRGECTNSFRPPVTQKRYLRGRSRSRTTSFARLSVRSPR